MILASNNAHKLEEFRAIFADMGIEIIPQSAAGCHFEVDETGETFEENAYLKAIAVTRATGSPPSRTIPALWSMRSAARPACTRPAIPAGTRIRMPRATRSCSITSATAPTARPGFVSCICCTFPNGDVLRACGTCEGSILFAPARGKRLRL